MGPPQDGKVVCIKGQNQGEEAATEWEEIPGNQVLIRGENPEYIRDLYIQPQSKPPDYRVGRGPEWTLLQGRKKMAN